MATTGAKGYSGKIHHSLPLAALLIGSLMVMPGQTQELQIPSYYGGSGDSGTSDDSTSGTNGTNARQQLIARQEACKSLATNIQITPTLIESLEGASKLLANPETGEIRVAKPDETPATGWMILDVGPAPYSDGYQITSPAGSAGQFSMTIAASAPLASPDNGFAEGAGSGFGGANDMVSGDTTRGTTVGATSVTESSQTTIGDTQTEIMADGTKVTTTPTETIDTKITTITAPNSKTIITETTTTTLIEGTVEKPALAVTGTPTNSTPTKLTPTITTQPSVKVTENVGSPNVAVVQKTTVDETAFGRDGAAARSIVGSPIDSGTKTTDSGGN